MSTIFIANLLALFLSLFVAGALLGAVFTHTRSGRAAVDGARRRLRALIFGWEFPPFNSGGLGVASLGLTRALSRQDVDITFVLPKAYPLSVPYAKMVAAELEEAGAKVTYAYPSATAADGTPLYGEDMIGQVKRYAKAGAQIAKREPHDIIYAHDWLAFGAGKAAKGISKKPLISHVHATEFDRSGGGRVNQTVYDLEREGMHAADRVIAVSRRTRDMAIQHYGVPREKTHAVWNGVDDETAPAYDEMRAGRLAQLTRAGHTLVLFAGRLTLQKGPDHFLNAAAKVAAKDPDVLFVMAGSGDMEAQLLRQAAGLGIGNRVLFPGFLRDHDLHEAYASADVYVMPSVSEPFGISALEAMRLGTPVIISKQSGVAEAVPEAIQVDFWDADALAQAIEQVLAARPKEREAHAVRGHNAAARLSWDRAASEIRAIMDELALSGI